MANTDIFNVNTGFDATLGFNSNWNYGSATSVGSNYQAQRPQYGSYIERAVSDAGYAFDMVFVDRPIEQVRYIERFFHQFKRGFFTVIDHDNAAREHVGRFTKFSAPRMQNANLKYTIRATFEEIPGCPMRNYPSDFSKWGHPLNVFDDNLVATAALSDAIWVGRQTAVAQAAGVSVNDLSSYELYHQTAGAGVFAQTEWIGWGFSCALSLAANLGICQLYLDGSLFIDGLDLSTGLFANSYAPYGLQTNVSPAGTANPVLALNCPNLPLGRHRLKVLALGTKNASATDTGIVFPSLEVMH